MQVSKVALVVLALGCGASTPPVARSIPDAIKVPAGQVQSLEAQAKGVQIYECKAKKDEPSQFEWTLRAPEATLFDATGKTIGKHYGGPTWEASDGSKVVGAVKARDPGPDAGAIPWLLLEAKSSDGNGVLTGTTSIQRIATVGGKAPATGCTAADAGKETRIDYAAVYAFFKAQ